MKYIIQCLLLHIIYYYILSFIQQETDECSLHHVVGVDVETSRCIYIQWISPVTADNSRPTQGVSPVMLCSASSHAHAKHPGSGSSYS